ncbi:hypothetical protein Q7C36_010009 [Tachysurus vachellii]|uniref:Glycosyltransferase family 92 protein n=1 Tax=Tachysurus vachellii TaxID=175792 RepID=A0AA88SZ63_TACVA|nr:hypothetical protein Q7C36_010009 [Tachysurus vachellii]
MIRTIAIVHRSENAEYQCLLCCNGTEVSVSATLNIHSDHFGFDYGTADIICQIPEVCPTPEHVAITSKSPKENGSLQYIHAFQPVRNQQKQEVFRYEFTVCISTMFDYENVLLLVQAMEMFKILGVQKVAIYKTNCSNVIQKVLDYYISQDFVELIPWSVSSYINVSRGWRKWKSLGELHYFGQIAALNDCLYRYMYKSHYVALQDLDEFILPLNLNNWTELLPELERKHGQESKCHACHPSSHHTKMAVMPEASAKIAITPEPSAILNIIPESTACEGVIPESSATMNTISVARVMSVT